MKKAITLTCLCNILQVKRLKTDNFQIIILLYFIFARNIDCGFSLSVPRILKSRNKKNYVKMKTPVLQYGPRCEKTGLRGFRPGPTQIRL